MKGDAWAPQDFADRTAVLPDRGRAESGRRILVVEDSPSARTLMQELLLRLGVTLPDLRLASTVSQAMQLFTNWRPDIVFVDIELKPPIDGAKNEPTTPPPGPDLPSNGAELAQQLLKRNPALKVVVCSASDPSDPRIRELVKKGRVEVLVKPVLASKVQAALDHVNTAPQAPARRG